MSAVAKAVLDVGVEFGGVLIGDQTARIGIKIDRSVMNIVAADEIFCGHRLDGRIVLGGAMDDPDQTSFIEDGQIHVDAVFDVKRISLTIDKISTGLTFSLADIDVESLAKFSKGSGRLVVENVSELADASDDGEDSEDDDHVPGTLKVSGEAMNTPLSKLFDGSVLKSLNKAKLNTVGDLANYTATEKQLIDIPGIGPGKAEKIENRMVKYWEDNPGDRGY